MADNILCRLMTSEDENPVRELLYNTFFSGGTIAKALKVESPRECRCMVEPMMLDAVKDGVSTVAVDEKTGTVVGTFVNLITDQDNSKLPKLSDEVESERKMRIIFNVISQVLEGIDLYENYGVPCALHLFMGVVKEEYRGRGLMCKMTDHSLKVGVERGIRLAYAEATSNYSRNALHKLGFETMKEVEYEQYTLDGARLFGDTGEQKTCSLEVKRLN